MEMNRKLFDYARLLLIAGIVVAIDQVTKAAVRSSLAVGEIYHPELWISQYARLLHLSNTGATNGILLNFNSLLAIVPIVVSIAIIYF